MTVRIRCVVCGKEGDTDDAAARAGARTYADGSLQPAADGAELMMATFPDGVVAGSCIGHTPDEARTAWVLTSWKLRHPDGSAVPT